MTERNVHHNSFPISFTAASTEYTAVSTGISLTGDSVTVRNCIIETVSDGVGVEIKNGSSNALVALNAKTADVAIMDSTLANYYLTVDSVYSKNLQLVDGLALADEQYGIAARKGSGLIKKINQALVDLTKDGTVNEIAKKYGLESKLIIDPDTAIDPLTESEKADWDYIVGQGKVIVGYTEFAPIAYRESK